MTYSLGPISAYWYSCASSDMCKYMNSNFLQEGLSNVVICCNSDYCNEASLLHQSFNITISILLLHLYFNIY